MADNTEHVDVKLPSGETITALVPAGMPDDQIHSMLRTKHPELFGGTDTPDALNALFASKGLPPLSSVTKFPQISQADSQQAAQAELTDKLARSGSFTSPGSPLAFGTVKGVTQGDMEPFTMGVMRNAPFVLASEGASALGEAIPAAVHPALRLLARMGLQGAAMGGASAVTGGTAKQDAIAAGTGAGGELVASGLNKVVPAAVQRILNIRGNQLSRGATPGEAVLSQTSAVTPKGIANQAQDVASTMTRHLEAMAQASPNPASVQPAIDVVDNAMATAQAKNSGAVLSKLQSLRDQLTKDVTTGNPLAVNTTPYDLLLRKRGVGDLINSWTKEEKSGVQSVLPQVYRAMDSELDRAVPGSQGLNQTIQSLIEAKKGAVRTANGQRTLTNLAGRAMTGTAAAGLGAGIGYAHGGPSEAARDAGIGAGTMLLANPTSEMMAARGALKLTSPLLRALLAGRLSRPQE